MAELGELADQRDAVAGKSALHCRPDTPQQRHRSVGEERGGLAPAENREAARLVEIGGELGEEFVVAQSDRHRNAECTFYPLGKRREKLGGTRAMKCFSAAEVEKRFVDRQ